MKKTAAILKRRAAGLGPTVTWPSLARRGPSRAPASSAQERARDHVQRTERQRALARSGRLDHRLQRMMAGDGAEQAPSASSMFALNNEPRCSAVTCRAAVRSSRNTATAKTTMLVLDSEQASHDHARLRALQHGERGRRGDRCDRQQKPGPTAQPGTQAPEKQPVRRSGLRRSPSAAGRRAPVPRPRRRLPCRSAPARAAS